MRRYITAPPCQAHSETSCEASDAAAAKAPTQRRRVLQTLKTAGINGLTDEQLQDMLGLNPSTQRPRRVELVQAGEVTDSGRTRPTKSGRRAVVWIAVRSGDQLTLA